MQNLKYTTFIHPDLSNPLKAAEEIKKSIRKSHNFDLQIDLSGMNVFDAVKVMVLTSAYMYKKAPEDKLKFKFVSNEIKNIIANFSLNNLEMV